jgi:dihydroorotase
MSNNETESTQVRKTVSFSKKRDKDLIGLDEFQDDFSYNAKQLMRDGLKFRQLMQSQNVQLNNASFMPSLTNPVNFQENTAEKEVKLEQESQQIEPKKPTNMEDFLNSKTKKSEISEEDRKRLEKNLDF